MGYTELRRPQGPARDKELGMTKMTCNECGKEFKKTIGPNTVEVRCPGCGGYDTEPDIF